MTVTVSNIGKRDVRGTAAVRTADVTISSYTTLGEPVTASTFGLKRLESVMVMGHPSPYSVNFDDTNVKLVVKKNGGNQVDLFPDIKGALNASRNTDAAATSGLNAGFVHAAGIDISVTTAVTTGMTNPDYPRNVVIEITNVGGATLVASNFIIIGTDQYGAAQTETLALDVSTPTLGAGKFRNQVGVKVFATVTSFAVSVAQPASTTAAIGLGTLIGLRSQLQTPAAADVLAVQKNTAAIASGTYTTSTTANAVLMGANLADNDEVYIEYKASASEASSTAAISKFRVEAIGR